jgi:hypothetical protein
VAIQYANTELAIIAQEIETEQSRNTSKFEYALKTSSSILIYDIRGQQ